MLQSQKYDSSFLCALWLLLLNNRVQKKGVYSHIRSSHHIPTGGWKSLEKKRGRRTQFVSFTTQAQTSHLIRLRHLLLLHHSAAKNIFRSTIYARETYKNIHHAVIVQHCEKCSYISKNQRKIDITLTSASQLSMKLKSK